jgi:hypothetical protein
MKRLLGLTLLIAGCGDLDIPRYMQAAPRSEEDSRRVAGEIRKELGPDARVDLVEDLFFVATNDTARSHERCKGTVTWVYRHLTKDFLARKPEKPIRVFLFRDKQTYEEYCKATYSKPPSTPFGFYMAHERKMVMNISTGLGTLAHEMVHPLVAEDFPAIPSWFNEGFASLYEQSGERAGKMVGYVNWRLRGLQKALREGKAVLFRDLVKTTTEQFYGDDRGVNYASARYLCLYLQETGKLEEFYKAFRAAADGDPTGAATLEKVSGKRLEDLDRVWQEWVLRLRPDE